MSSGIENGSTRCSNFVRCQRDVTIKCILKEIWFGWYSNLTSNIMIEINYVDRNIFEINYFFKINIIVMHSSCNTSNLYTPQHLIKRIACGHTHSQTFNRMWDYAPAGGLFTITSGSSSIRKLVWFSYGGISSRVVQSVRVKGPRPTSLRAVYAR